MQLGLEGKIVLVTGGSGGIGGPTARLFAREGAHVALTYHRNAGGAEKVASGIEQEGGTALALRMDLGDPGSISAAVESVAAAWGGPDVCVLSASTAAGPDPANPVRFESVPAREWRDSLRSEVEGAFHTVQAVLPGMRDRRWGRLVFLSASLVGRGFTGEEAYTAGKSALHGLSRTLATELVADGVLSNVVAPGPTITDRMLAKVPESIRGELAGQSLADVRRILEARMPHLRFTTPEEIARVVVFLSSPANQAITGAVIPTSRGA
jgi:NAD(P)-dependent dehydrogenase (short-subunit alcohol dehydrogenase family)